MTHFQAAVLGIVQGLTEFLPISSSAHLVLFPWIFKWSDPGLSFDVLLHLGTLIGVLLYFISDLYRIFVAGMASIFEFKLGFDPNRRMFWFLVLGTIPAGLSGILFHQLAESVFRDPLLIAVWLSLVGFLLYWADGTSPTIKSLKELKGMDVLWIGLAQAFAILPGVSRSGATMAMARFLGYQRESAAHVSFLLSVPIIGAAVLYESKNFIFHADGLLFSGPVLTGFFASLISGFLAIYFLMNFLRVADFKVFAWYRILLATGIVLLSLFRV